MTTKTENELITYKLILLGDSQVGKTAFFKKLSGGKFVNTVSTVGVDRKTLYLDNLEVKINNKLEKRSFDITLYDTAGQERFRSITKSYINKTDGILLMYDITNRESFDHIESWLDSIIDTLSDWKIGKYLIALFGNKLDLVSNDEILDNEEKKRKITYNEGKQKSEENEVLWLGEISVKDFSFEEINKLFSDITVKIFDKVGAKHSKSNTKITKPEKKKKKKFC